MAKFCLIAVKRFSTAATYLAVMMIAGHQALLHTSRIVTEYWWNEDW
jgi:hypothetical protein